MLKSKRVFLISIFTILISMAMLISATFAWFTSTVTTNANAVKSATYNITATITKEDSTSINPTTENNVISITFPNTGTYNVTIALMVMPIMDIVLLILKILIIIPKILLLVASLLLLMQQKMKF